MKQLLRSTRSSLIALRRAPARWGRPPRRRIGCVAIVVVLVMVAVAGSAFALRVQRTIQRVSSATDVRAAAVSQAQAAPAAPSAPAPSAAPTPAPAADAQAAPAPPENAAAVEPAAPSDAADDASEAATPELLSEPLNVLLIGVDLRQDQRQESVRSDTLIVVHVDPIDKWASMLSLPRDSVAAIPSDACAESAGTKINAAYACGWKHPEIYGLDDTPASRQDAGAALAAQTVENFLDITIDHTVQVDFGGFEDLVDAIGGVTIDVPRRIVDDAYPTDDYRTMRLVIPAGEQHMDGVTALRYARTRHIDNDFGRAERQQQVLQAILDQINNQSLLERVGAFGRLLDVAGQSVRTTLPLDTTDFTLLRGAAQLASEMSGDRVQRLQLKPELTADGTSSVWSERGSDIVWKPAYVRRMAYLLEQPPAALGLTPPVIQVQNGTRTPRLAARATSDLAAVGYHMARAADAPTKGIPNTLILTFTGRDDAAQELADRLGVDRRFVREADSAAAPPDVDIVVRLGNDYVAAER